MIFGTWVDGPSDMKEFFDNLNSFQQTIKFTMESSDFEVNFLDVTVSILKNTLQTDLYLKNTDTHQFLHSKSCHRRVYTQAIPYGQAVRIKRIFLNKIH